MRLTKILFRQHLGWHTKMKWRAQKSRVLNDNGVIDRLNSAGIKVVNGVEDIIGIPVSSDVSSV